MTSTYDHRVIQGAESGAFLRRIEELLQGEDGFYEEVFRSLGLEPPPAAPRDRRRPVRGRARGRAAGGARRRGDAAPACRRRPRWSRRTACTATSPRASTRSAPSRSAIRRSSPRRSGLTPEMMRRIPARVLRIAVPGRDARRGAARTCARPTAARSPTRSSTSPTTSSASGCASGSSRASTGGRSSPEEKRAVLERLTEVGGARDLHPQGLPRARRASRSRASTRSSRCSTRRSSWPPTPARARSFIGMAHRGRLNVLAHAVGRPYESILAEFEGEKDIDVDTARPSGGTGDVKYHQGAHGHLRRRVEGKALTVTLAAEPEPPRVRRPGRRGAHARRPDRARKAREAAARPAPPRCRS